jgi:hypothetical protein
MAGWWPSRYGAGGGEAGTLNKVITVADHLAGRLGATREAEAQPLVTAHA